jgi:23S rRNA (cytidine1920-2'-O)/16S rRNA (cytidine1409-2'-O)-methyltransferase
MKYVSRGGFKLAKALQEFSIEVKNKIVIDVGASTGGFTDCLLQNGAAKVYTVDVNYGQLAWQLRQDPRVKVFERTNIRYLTLDKLIRTANSKLPTPNLAVIDVSFISLSKVLPVVYNLLTEEGDVIALIKPQFEARRAEVAKGGVVKDEQVRREVIERVKNCAVEGGFQIGGLIESPITGAVAGNVEYLLYLTKGKDHE